MRFRMALFAVLGLAPVACVAVPPVPIYVDPMPLKFDAEHYADGVRDHEQAWFLLSSERPYEYRLGATWYLNNYQAYPNLRCETGDPGADFQLGCRDARVLTIEPALRRREDPSYRRGWDSVTAPSGWHYYGPQHH